MFISIKFLYSSWEKIKDKWKILTFDQSTLIDTWSQKVSHSLFHEATTPRNRLPRRWSLWYTSSSSFSLFSSLQTPHIHLSPENLFFFRPTAICQRNRTYIIRARENLRDENPAFLLCQCSSTVSLDAHTTIARWRKKTVSTPCRSRRKRAVWPKARRVWK